MKQKYCNCHNTLTVKQCIMALKDEVVEFIQEPSLDEFSDIIYCVNRFAGTITKQPYLKVLPGDKTHVDKIRKRMMMYGCIRSTKHLVKGRCPNGSLNPIQTVIGKQFKWN